MEAEKGVAAVALEALDEQVLRCHVVLAGGGKRNLTTEQLVDLLCSTFPEEYPPSNRELLTERVAKITPLPSGSGDATEEPTPVTNKRRKIGELGNGEDRLRDVSENNRPMFRDLFGMDTVINKLKSDVILPLLQWKLLRRLGVKYIPRILLHGPPRCGKTTLVRALANEAGFPLYEISAADLVSGASGDAPEENIRELFSAAYMRAPSIVFIDAIDAMTSKTESSRKDIVNQLMACMDEPCRLVKPVDHDAGSESSNNSLSGYVLVIGATNSPDALDPVLRRQFDREIVIDVPRMHERSNILSVLTCDVDIGNIARCTMCLVLQDLAALVNMAASCAANRIMETRRYEIYGKRLWVQIEDWYGQQFSDEEMKNLKITTEDFVEAAKMVRPSSRLEGFSTVPNAKWDDVGGLQLLKLEFERHIVKRIKFPEIYKGLGVDLMTSFFLYGPSGCGKTLIVKALANEAGANFLHIKGPKLLSCSGSGDLRKLVVHIIFNYARAHLPCIVFFNQLEAIIPVGEGQSADFIQLVIELCNVRTSGLYIICATNRPNVPSRLVSKYFDTDLYIPLPTPEERGAILKALARNKPIDADVDLMALGKDIACENFSGADLSRLMKVAIKAAIDRPTLSGGDYNIPWTIKDVDFKKALPKISPYVSSKELKNWELVANTFHDTDETMEW